LNDLNCSSAVNVFSVIKTAANASIASRKPGRRTTSAVRSLSSFQERWAFHI
jgi:hypothetical protein